MTFHTQVLWTDLPPGPGPLGGDPAPTRGGVEVGLLGAPQRAGPSTLFQVGSQRQVTPTRVQDTTSGRHQEDHKAMSHTHSPALDAECSLTEDALLEGKGAPSLEGNGCDGSGRPVSTVSSPSLGSPGTVPSHCTLRATARLLPPPKFRNTRPRAPRFVRRPSRVRLFLSGLRKQMFSEAANQMAAPGDHAHPLSSSRAEPQAWLWRAPPLGLPC